MSPKISVIVPAYNAEDHLSEALDSLVNQTFPDFEVIIINDGSTDGTQKIIHEYCEKYPNFKSFVQHNSGVSKARNRGIDESSGDYIAFLDADDLFSRDALEKLYESAVESNAELVIGVSSHFNSFMEHIHVNTVKLSNEKQIDPFDKHLVWTFSQSNKLFLRKKIIETEIRFPDLKYAEDGVFVLEFEYCCSRIAGCPHRILFYRKHDFWEGISATQRTDIGHINDFLKSHNLMYDNAVQYIKCDGKTAHEMEELQTKYDIYLNELLYRRATLFCNEFYRLFWKTDETALKIIKGNILSLKEALFPETGLKLQELNQDIFINNIVVNRALMAENPIITIILNPKDISKEDMGFMLDSIYAQDFPAFEVLIPRSLSDKVFPEFMYENLHLIDSKGGNFKNFGLKESKGKYVLFIDDFIVLDSVTLRVFFNNIYNGDFDMVSAGIGQLHNYKVSDYPSQEVVYSYRNTVKNGGKSKFNYLDLYLVNKLIKIDFLKEIAFEFSDDPAYDVKQLYDLAKFKKIHKRYIFSDKNEKELFKSLKTRDKSIFIKTFIINLFKKPVYMGLKLKRFLT